MYYCVNCNTTEESEKDEFFFCSEKCEEEFKGVMEEIEEKKQMERIDKAYDELQEQKEKY